MTSTCSELVARVEQRGFRFDLAPDGLTFRVYPKLGAKQRQQIAAFRDEIIELLRERRDASCWAMLEQVSQLFPGAKIEQADTLLDAWVAEQLPGASETDKRSLDLIVRARLIQATKSADGSYDQTTIKMFEEDKYENQ